MCSRLHRHVCITCNHMCNSPHVGIHDLCHVCINSYQTHYFYIRSQISGVNYIYAMGIYIHDDNTVLRSDVWGSFELSQLSCLGSSVGGVPRPCTQPLPRGERGPGIYCLHMCGIIPSFHGIPVSPLPYFASWRSYYMYVHYILNLVQCI